MPRRMLDGLNSSLERWLPEQRLFLRSDNATRFMRLRPLTILSGLLGSALIFGWALIASSILMIDAISSGSSREQVIASQSAFERRLNQLSEERDARATEALAAQERFSIALEQVSRMQSQLQASEEKRRELETGLKVVQDGLRTAMIQRDQARAAQRTDPGANRGAELEVALDILSGELRQTAEAHQSARRDAEDARLTSEKLKIERDLIIARNDEVMQQIEGAMNLSIEPLRKVFKSVGMNPDDVLKTIRRSYSGQGGPLVPIAYSTSGSAALNTQGDSANQIIGTLDQMNSYRIAMEKLPLAVPVKDRFRYSSGFGRRWGRMHEGIDLAGPTGTTIYAPGDGVVTFAGRQSGYGNLIKIKHAFGIETRYGHLSRIRVKKGQRVSQGEVIGDMGNTGRSTGPHLHYEVRVNGRAVDPMRFIKAASNVF